MTLRAVIRIMVVFMVLAPVFFFLVIDRTGGRNILIRIATVLVALAAMVLLEACV